MFIGGEKGPHSRRTWYSDERVWFGAYLLAIILFVCLSLFLISRAAVAPRTDPLTITDSMSISEQTARIEVTLIRDQLDENKQYNDRLLQIVLWSLGTVVGVAAAVLGANLFASYRATQRERELLDETKASLLTLEASFRESRARLAGFIVDTAIKTAERETISNNYQEAIDALHKVCVEGDVKSGGHETGRAWMTAISAVLSNIQADLEMGEPLSVELAVVEKMREPVITVGSDFWGIRWQVVIDSIDLITQAEPQEDAPRQNAGEKG